MGNLSDDLDRFLRSEGRRILMDAEGVKTEPFEPLTEADIEDFDSMNLEHLDADALEDLLEKAEELQDDMEDREPEDESSEEHDLWEDQLSRVEDFMDRIQDRLDDLEEE